MGEVYKARHLNLDRIVALKILASWYIDDHAYVKRFLLEARAAAKLEHPNIVRVYDADSQNDCHYIVMQYVSGQTLSALVNKNGPLPESELVEVACGVARGLEEAHARGLVHRDVKPGNIMISDRGEVLVMDFGLVKDTTASTDDITRTGQLVGSPHYMSPEQCRGANLDGRSDLYSLGSALYFAATGERPYDGETAVSIISKHLEGRPLSPRSLKADLSEEMASIIEKLLAKDPDKRFQNAGELLNYLEKLRREGIAPSLADKVKTSLHPGASSDGPTRITTGKAGEEPGEVAYPEDAPPEPDKTAEEQPSQWVKKKKHYTRSRRYKMKRNLVYLGIVLAIAVLLILMRVFSD